MSIAVGPATVSIPAGNTRQFAAMGTFSDGSSQNITSTVTWSSSNTTALAIASSGLATAFVPGTATIEATLGSVSGSTTATVVNSGLAGWWPFNDGAGVTAADASGNGNPASLYNGIGWISGPLGGAISATGGNQYATVEAINLTATQAITWAAWINRSYGNGSAALLEDGTNFNSIATGFGFFPDDGSDCGMTSAIMTGMHGDVGYTTNCYTPPSSGVWHHIAVVYDKSQPGTSAVSLYIDGVLQTPVKQPYTATNSNTFGNNPLYLFSRGGASEFTDAEMEDLRIYSQALTATQIQQIYQQGLGTLLSIAVTPANASLSVGSALQYTATGTYSSGTAQSITNSVTWNSTDPAAAIINASGLATGAGNGNTTIQAVSGAITGSTGLSVASGPTLLSLSVTPATFSVPPGGAEQLTATGTYSDGSTQSLTNSITWTSSNSAVATVSSTGLVTGIAAGSAGVQAVSGSVTGSAQLTVATASNLVGWWQFNDGAGTTAADSSGNGNSATLVNGVSWVTGQTGDAVSADGSNQYVSIPAVNLSSTQAVTWAAWINRSYGNGASTLFEDSANFNSSTTGFGFFPDDGSDCGMASAMMTGVHGDVGYTASCYTQPSSGVWHHIAVVYDKSQPGANVISLYVDGVLQTPAKQPYIATNTDSFGNNPLYLFSRGGASQFSAGEIDDLRLYDQALSAGQIQQIYQQGLGPLLAIAVTPANSTVAIGSNLQYTATGSYSSGMALNLTSSVNWSSTNAAAAGIGSSGLATGAAVGSTTIQAVSGSISGSTGLSVTALATLQSLSITPATFSIATGGTEQLAATGTYSDGSTRNLTSSVTWTSSNTAVATVTSTGLVTGVASGNTSIQAILGSVSGSAQATVSATSNLVGWWQFDDGAGTSAADSSGNGNTATLVNGVSWVTGQTGDAVSANGVNQYVTVPAVNLSSAQAVTWAAWINRNYGSESDVLLEDTADFNSSTTGFGFFPDDSADCGASSVMMIAIRGNVGYAASCYTQPSSGVWHHIAAIYDKTQPGASALSLYVDGALQTPVKQPFTATNIGTFGNNPLYLFSRGGTSQYSAAEMDDLRIYGLALTAAQIQQIYQQGFGTLVSIAVTPSNGSLGMGFSTQYTATGTYSNGNTVNLTNSAAWSSTNTAVVTINGSGLASGVAAGSATIQAVYNAVTGSTGVTVTPPPLVSISVTPANPVIASGATQQFTATGTYGDGSTQNLTGAVAWSSTNSAVATIAASGLAAASGTGSTTIKAVSGSVTGTTGLTITSSGATLQSISLSPVNGQLPVGSNLQFTATGVYSDGTSQNLTAQANWSSAAPAVATINASGVATGVALGTTTIQGTIGAFSASISLTVTPSGLVGWWPFDDGSGTIAVDASGNGNPAVLVNGVSWVPGQMGDAVSANGVDQYVSIPAIDLSGTSAATLALWVNRTWTLDGNTVLFEDSTNFNSTGKGFALFPDDQACEGISAGLHGNAGYSINCFNQPTSGAWHHLAVIYDKTQAGNQEVQLYVDGVLQVPTANLYTVANSNAFGDNPIYLFSRAGTQLYSSGEIDDLRLYNRALSATEVEQVYSIGAANSDVTLQSIAITPGNGSVALYGTQQFTATGTYSDGSTRNLTSSVTWASSNSAVASIGSSGLATGVSAGAANIQAAYQSIAASTSVVVVPELGEFVQWASSDSGATLSSTSTQNRNATSGDLILVFSHWDNQAATATLTDQVGNTYIPIFPPTNSGTASSFQVWYAKNITGGVPLQVTATYSAQTSSLSVVDVIEYAGLDQTSPLDTHTSATGNGVTQSSGNMPVTTANDETVIGLFGYGGYANPYTAGAGFTFRNYDASTMLEDMSVASTGVFQATASSSIAANWAAFVIGFKNQLPIPPGITLNPSTVIGSNASTGTIVLSAPAPQGGALIQLSSSKPLIAGVPANINVTAGATQATFPIFTGAVTFTTSALISATYGSTESASLTVLPATMSQIASDSFNRADSPTLGSNWTPLVGSANVPLRLVGNQIQASASGTLVGKELFYGGLNWAPDQFSQAQIIAAAGAGYEGPAVRMTSKDTYYACLVYTAGAGNAAVAIVLDNATNTTTLASSSAATVTAGDTIQCSVQGANLTMTDATTSATLLTASDSTIPSGYPGVVDYAGGTLANYTMANWSGGAIAASLTATQFASDNFSRPDALSLGPNWVVGSGHGPIQIVDGQIEPYPAGGQPPAKEHYIAYGPFPNDQWSQIQLVYEDTIGDVATELRASDTADNMYVCDVNLTGGPGTGEARIVKVVNGTIIPLVINQQWASISPGDSIRGQVQGSLISLLDITTGSLILTAFNTTFTSGYPGISLQADTGAPSDHIAANWSGGSFQ